MPDGGMGSVRFVQEPPEQRIFGEQIAEGLFHDADGVPVSVALNIDQFDDLFELDLWKVDFSPLIRYPDADEVEIIERHGKLGFHLPLPRFARGAGFPAGHGPRRRRQPYLARWTSRAKTLV